MPFQLSPIVLTSLLSVVSVSLAQFSPPITYSTVLKSPINPNITISYKSPEPGTCTTAFPTQKQYTGYVSLPPHTLNPYQQNYSVNTFFWFIEARQSPETAPLTIWLNGGPGSSSMIGLFREAGPCEVVEMSNGSYGTQARTWGWDRSSNVLFLDQPTQVGFSFDTPVNGTLSLITSNVVNPPRSKDSSTPPHLLLNGTFSSGNALNTQNTSFIAASASWHFLQGFLAAFPQYNPGTRPNSTAIRPVGINLFAESYGGIYGPAFASYYGTQNAKRATGEIPLNSTLEIKLSSVGIINGLIDELIQAPFWPKFAYNNSYGIQLIDQTAQLNAMGDFTSSGGCKDLIQQCRDSIDSLDPQGEGDEAPTNKLCSDAKQACFQVENAIRNTGKSWYDIRVDNPDTFPSLSYLEYLNTAPVQRSIGAKVNYTESSRAVWDAFSHTGDEIRGTALSSLASLLTTGVRIAFIYGDSDYICNWHGGEAVSLALASRLSTYATAFPDAGYADIIANSSYVGGAVRQYGNLSFSRIYDSGHLVPAYQPETAFTVFTRIIQGADIGTGNRISLSTFASQGPANSDRRNKVPDQQPSTCWIRSMQNTCTDDEARQIQAGKGVVINGVWYEKARDYTPPESSVVAGVPGSYPTSTPTSSREKSGKGATTSIAMTGVYTATGRPTPTSGASSVRFRRSEYKSPLGNIGELWGTRKTISPRKQNFKFTIAWTIPAGIVGMLGFL